MNKIKTSEGIKEDIKYADDSNYNENSDVYCLELSKQQAKEIYEILSLLSYLSEPIRDIIRKLKIIISSK